MYILWKDHKPDFLTALQTRPVCDGTSGPLARISEVLVLVLGEYMRGDSRMDSCVSTEEMLRKVEDCNRYDLEPNVDYSLFSMDVASLYPSLDHRDVKEAMFELVINSKIELKVYETKELAKYLALVISDEEVRLLDIDQFLPKRYNEGTRNSKPTIAFLDKYITSTYFGAIVALFYFCELRGRP